MSLKFQDRANSYREQMTHFLRDIVSIPSMNGDEKKVLMRVEAEMKKLEYDEVWYDDYGNLFGRMGSGSRILAIDGHLDTVDIGNIENWKYAPFEAVIEEGTLYGRGACDQKGGVVSAVYAGRILKEIGVPEDISLLICATVLEEDYEGISWRYIIEQTGLEPEFIILTEPTNLDIKIGQRGRMEMKVTISGVSSHGSAPERGDNAIYKAASILKDIEQLNGSYSSESDLGKATITVTDIRSSAPSLCAVADSCTLHIDRRLTEGEDKETCLNEIRTLQSVKVHNAKVNIPVYNVKSYTGLSLEQNAYYPSWIMNKDERHLVGSINSYRTLFSSEPVLDVWGFSTNGVSSMGLHGIPTIGFGPGNENYAHTPEEHIQLDQLAPAAAFLAFCAYEF